MRLNTRNIALLVIGLVVIIGVIVLNNLEDSEQAAEPTEVAEENTGRLFPDAEDGTLVRFEVRELPQPDDATPEPTEEADADEDDTADDEEATEEPDPFAPGEVIITKDDEDIWTITQATNATDRETDQTIVVGSVGLFVEIEYTNTFDVDNLDEFGLENPQFEVLAVDGEDNTFRALVGNQNPQETRYYVQTEAGESTVYLVASDILGNILNYINQPPYVPAPTATPSPFPTANPFSEVEQTATAQTALDELATQAAATETGAEAGPDLPADAEEETDADATEEADDDATDEADDDATDEADDDATDEADDNATDEADDEAESTEEADDE